MKFTLKLTAIHEHSQSSTMSLLTLVVVFLAVGSQLLTATANRIWSNTIHACIVGYNNKQLGDGISFADCKKACERETAFECRSVDYWPGGQGFSLECQLSTADRSSVPTDLFNEPCYGPYKKKNIYAEFTECPSPWFPIGNQCFRVVDNLGESEMRSWTGAAEYCNELSPGADLAQPYNLRALGVYMVDHGFDNSQYWYWLGGPGEPDTIKECILYWPGRGPTSLTGDGCMLIGPFVCERH